MRIFRRWRKDMAWAVQSNRENLRSHFDAEAGGYLRRWRRFPWSAPRGRETAAIRRLLGRVDVLDVLDLGCGAGFHTRLFHRPWGAACHGGRSIAGDAGGTSRRERDAASGGRRNRRLRHAVSGHLSAGLLEFVPDPVAVLKNARRGMSPGGRLILPVPAANAVGLLYRLYHKRNGLTARVFDRTAIGDAARAAGWSVARLGRAGIMATAAELIPRPDSAPGPDHGND